MPKLTRKRLAEVRAVLDASLFTSASFQIESGATNSSMIVSVKLLDAPKCYLNLHYEGRNLSIPAKGHMRTHGFHRDDEEPVKMIVHQSPGDFVEAESSEVADFSGFINCLRTWTTRLKSEILFVDLARNRLSEFLPGLTKRLDEQCADPKMPFTEAEREELMGALRDLQERILKLKEGDVSLHIEATEMNQALTELACATFALPKRSWYRTTCSKLYEISSRVMTSKPGKKLMEDAIEKLLDLSGSSPKTPDNNS